MFNLLYVVLRLWLWYFKSFRWVSRGVLLGGLDRTDIKMGLKTCLSKNWVPLNLQIFQMFKPTYIYIYIYIYIYTYIYICVCVHNTHTERQTDRQTDGQRDRQRETDRERQTERDRQTERQTDRQTHRQRDRQTDRQTDRHNVYILCTYCVHTVYILCT